MALKLKTSGVWYYKHQAYETVSAGWGFRVRIRGRLVYDDYGFRTKSSAMKAAGWMRQDYFN